jgi:hypothetical protein
MSQKYGPSVFSLPHSNSEPAKRVGKESLLEIIFVSLSVGRLVLEAIVSKEW